MANLNIFMDTNIVKKINSNLMIFELNETYKILKSFIVENELNDIKVFIPKIVIEELITQYIEEYKVIKKDIEEINTKLIINLNRINVDIEPAEYIEFSNREYTEHIRQSCEEFIRVEESFITITDFPCGEIMIKIIDRAIKKKRPFFSGHFSQKKFSDAGFKDVIFLESIIEELQNQDGDYLIISKDKIFGEIILSNEISGKSGSVIEKDIGKDIVKHLEFLLNVEDMSKYICFIKSEYYSTTIKSVLNCNIVNNFVEINKIEDDNTLFIDNTSLIEINGEEKQVIVRLSEENDFLEIWDKDTNEVIFEWTD